MTLARCSEGEVEVVTLVGDLNAAIAGTTHEEIQGVIDSGRARLVLDLAQVRFVDSSGLSVLVAALKAARAAGGDVALAGLRPEVRSVIQLTRLDRVLDLYNDSGSAIAAMAG